MKPLNVLSLFDGISCCHLALDRAEIPINTYYASEIDKNVIKATQTNFPNTIQLGDIKNWKEWDIDWGSIDLVTFGNCCQSFSFAGKMLNFNDPRGKLFFDSVDIVNKIKKLNPNMYFLCENVKTKEEYSQVFSDLLGVDYIEINSSLVSAQNRIRRYWTNIPNVKQPKDKNIKLKDILENIELNHPAAIRGRKLNKATIVGRRLDEHGHRQDYNKDIPITQCLEVRATNTDKSNCLTTVDKDNVLTSMPIGRHPDAFNHKDVWRYYTLTELYRLQTLPENYLNMISTSAARKAIGNGWTVDVIVHIFKGLKGE